MKKASLESLVRYLNGEEVANLPEIKEEIEAELMKGKAKAEANRAVYAELHDKVIGVLRSATAPVTAQEIATELSESRSKISYGLRNYWASEVVVDTTGKVHTYRLA